MTLRPTAEDRWSPLIDTYLARFRSRGIFTADVDRAEQWAGNASEYTAPGSWRAKIVNGTLFVKPIHLFFNWRERASALRMLLLAIRSTAEPLPDLDIVYASADVDPTGQALRRCRSRGRTPCDPLPLLTNARASDDSTDALPLPEFTWFGSGDLPPWCQLSRTLHRTAAAQPWSLRDRRAYFSGSLSTGLSRQQLRALGAAHPSVFNVRDVGFVASGHVAKQDRDRVLRKNSSSTKLAVEPSHACSFRYLLSMPGFGYSSRLRQLLACGGVVVHVEHDSEEFFAPLLKNNTHLIRLPGGRGTGGGSVATRSVERRLLPVLHELHADDARSRRLARAARDFAREWLEWPRVLRYVVSLLRGYGRLFRSPVSLGEGYERVASEADLLRVLKLCSCDSSSAHFDALCIHQRGAGQPYQWRRKELSELKKRPGYIGPHCEMPTYAGTPMEGRARSTAPKRPKGSELNLCCPVRPKRGVAIAGCWQPRCCKGFDCPTVDLGCPAGAAARARGRAHGSI